MNADTRLNPNAIPFHPRPHNKKHEVEDFTLSQNIDIMILAETFLSSSTADSLLSIPYHALFRRDHPSHGGGLAAYVNNRFQARVVGDHTNIEPLLLEIRSHQNRILLGGVYRPPGEPVQFWRDLSNAVDTAAASMPTSPLILTSDFNVDVSQRQAPQLDDLHCFCDQFNISNKVQDTTRIAPHGSRTTLDLALAADGAITSCTVLPCTISDHFAVVIDLPFTCTVEPPAVKCMRNLARIDMNRFANDLHHCDLENFSTAQTVDAMWYSLTDKIFSVLDEHAPVRTYLPNLPRARPSLEITFPPRRYSISQRSTSSLASLAD